jgi:uncharacterized protein YPO0396
MKTSSIPKEHQDKFSSTNRNRSMSMDERKHLLEQLIANKKQFLQKYQERYSANHYIQKLPRFDKIQDRTTTVPSEETIKSHDFQFSLSNRSLGR